MYTETRSHSHTCVFTLQWFDERRKHDWNSSAQTRSALIYLHLNSQLHHTVSFRLKSVLYTLAQVLFQRCQLRIASTPEHTAGREQLRADSPKPSCGGGQSRCGRCAVPARVMAKRRKAGDIDVSTRISITTLIYIQYAAGREPFDGP